MFGFSLTLFEVLGWVASALVLATFSLKTMIPLRAVAIASNIAFMSYGYAGHLVPVAVLHSILLPINVYRLLQLRSLVRRTREAAKEQRAAFPWEKLAHLLATKRLKAGETLIEKGTIAESLYILLEGSVRILGTNETIGKGEPVGEFALFSSDRRRTATVTCETDVVVGVLSETSLWELFFQNPEFGTYLVKTIVSRTLPRSAVARPEAG